MKKMSKIAGLLIAACFIICCSFSAGCITDNAPGWTPNITQLTQFDDYNFYLTDYTNGDYKLDELIAENITDLNVLKKRIVDLLAPDSGIVLNIADKIGCSVFAASDNSDYIFGRNFDLYDTSCLIVHTKPENGYESFAFANVNMLNKEDSPDPMNGVNALLSPYVCMDGLNEKGVAIAINAAEGPAIMQQRGKPAMMAPLAIRLVLDKAADTEDAVNLLDQFDAQMMSAFQYFICDAKGDTAIVNYINNEMTVTRGKQLMTNFYLCEIPENYPAGHGQDRYEIAKEQLEEMEYRLNTSEAFDVLKSIQQTPETGGLGQTQWSVVYHLNGGFADAVCHRHWEKPIEFALKEELS